MKRHIIPIVFVVSLAVGFLVNIIPQHALANGISVPPAPTLDATGAEIQSAAFTWVNVQEIDAVFTEASGPVTVQFVNVSGMANYWNSDPATGSDAVNHTYQYPSGVTCGSNKSIIWANPYYSTKGEQYFYAQIWANSPGKVGTVCREVDITVGNLTVGSVSNSNAFFTFSGTSIVRSDEDGDYTFVPSGFTNIWVKSNQTGSTCPDVIVYNPGAGDAMGDATLYPLSDGGSSGFSAPPTDINAASSCSVNNNSSDVNDDAGILGAGSAQSSDGANAKTGAVTLHVNGTPPTGATGPTGSGSSITTTTGNTNGCEPSQNLYSSSTPDTCLMPTCALSLNPATWIICPIVTAGEKLVGQLDNGINSMLDVNTCQYFANINIGSNCGSNPINGTTSTDFYSAWASFRDIALGVIVIAALVMILAQAIGVEALSAYSFKKMMPRILVVIIGISVSWYILAFAVQISNDLGDGIRYLIYSPFTNLSQNKEIMGGGDAAISSLLVLGAGVALGLVGILTLVLTAAIAVVAGFGLLLFRDLAIIVFIVLAPLAIAFYALPNTEKLWKMWSSNFIKILLMFPIVAAFIAAGRVFAAILYTDNNTLDQLMAFVVYFAPYFMIPTAFKLAGGLMASAGNVAASVRARVNQPVAGVRKNMLGKNLQRMQTGTRFQGSNPLARTFNRATSGAALGWKGHFGVGNQGRGGLDLKKRAAMRQAIQDNPQLAQLGFDDDAIALMALSGGTRRGAENVAKIFKDKAGWTDDRVNQAMGTASAVGFSDINAGASLDIMAQNKSRALTGKLAGQTGMDLVRQSATAISHGNQQLQGNMVGSFSFNSRQAGRLDLGGEATGEALLGGWQRSTVGQHSQAFGASTQAFGDSFVQTLQSDKATDRHTAAIALTEMNAMLPNATGENQKIINLTLANAGVNTSLDMGVEQQLANLANGLSANGIGPARPDWVGVNQPTISAREISRSARVYDQQNVPNSERGGGEPPGGTTPTTTPTTPSSSGTR